ncbi:MAG: endonuclease NucS [Actinomycetota bacterium]|nr:endonuclease NucS [Actinomycetota bacterium]
MAIWRMTEAGPVVVPSASLDLERRLEDMIVADPSMTGSELLVVGRQVPTSHGGFIDVLAVDADGDVHVLELKRDRTPREVVAQVLDYGSWAQDLTLDEVRGIYVRQSDGDFDEAFSERFGAAVPDVFNGRQQLTVIASELDAASDRIVTYLAERFDVPLNAVFFRHFRDDGSDYLARTWLIPPEEAEARSSRRWPRAAKRPWNGRDFYVILGTAQSERDRWAMCRRYSFVGAGGGSWYTKPLRNLTAGKRVFAYVGGAGYVGVGEVTGPIVLLRDFEVHLDGATVRVVDQAEVTERTRTRALEVEDEETEYAVPARWLVDRPIEDAVSEPGLFASQVTVCKLRDDRTIEVVSAAFGLDAPDPA